MSHVDEGALNAYLDGALEEYPTGEARRIRAHLERCEVCARALTEARKVRDEADALLSIPEVDVSAPPLEELRTLARSASEAGDAAPRGMPLHRLGWAASVVLALGVGWMLRGGVPEGSNPSAAGAMSASDVPVTGQEFVAPAPEAPAVASVERGQAEAPVEVDRGTQGSEAPARRAESRVAEVVPAEPTPQALPAADVVAVDMAYPEVADTEEAVADLADMVAAADRSVASESSMAQVGTRDAGAGMTAGVGTAVVAESSAVGMPDESIEEDVPVSSDRSSLAARSPAVSSALQVDGFALRERESRQVDAGEAPEPGSLVVPGLEVVSIVWREEGVVPAGVRVLQRLDNGGVLELIHLPAGFDPDAVEAVEPGMGQLVVPRDQGWLVMRGPLSEEEFRAMLDRMDSPTPE